MGADTNEGQVESAARGLKSHGFLREETGNGYVWYAVPWLSDTKPDYSVETPSLPELKKLMRRVGIDVGGRKAPEIEQQLRFGGYAGPIEFVAVRRPVKPKIEHTIKPMEPKLPSPVMMERAFVTAYDGSPVSADRLRGVLQSAGFNVSRDYVSNEFQRMMTEGLVNSVGRENDARRYEPTWSFRQKIEQRRRT